MQRPLEEGREPLSLPIFHLLWGSRLLPSHVPYPFTLPSLLVSHLPSSCLSPLLPGPSSYCALCLLSSPCRNRATCQDGPQGPRCLCPTGYTGSSCQVRGTEPGVLRREGLESSGERVSGTKGWAVGKSEPGIHLKRGLEV